MRLEIKLLLIAETLFVFGSGLYGPIYAIFVKNIGGDILDAGIAYAIFLIVMATMEYPIGRILDKYNKKYFLMPCYLLVALVIFGYIFVNSVMQLFLLQIIWGIAIAVGDPSWDSWFSDIISKKSSGFSWGMYHMLTGYSAGISALIGGIIGQFLGFSILFTIGGSFAIISFFIILFTKPEKFGTKSNKKIRIFHTYRKHLYKRRIHIKKR